MPKKRGHLERSGDKARGAALINQYDVPNTKSTQYASELLGKGVSAEKIVSAYEGVLTSTSGLGLERLSPQARGSPRRLRGVGLVV